MGPAMAAGGRASRRLSMVASAAVLAALLATPAVRAAPSSDPRDPTAGEWFAFSYDIYLDNGAGNYSGYTEQTLENYRYDIESVVGSNVTVFGHGTWTYSNNSGGSSSGGWTETFSFSDTTRKYLWGFDVNGTYTDPSVWFWIPAPVQVGEELPILDANYTVTSLRSDVWQGTVPVPDVGIELQASGAYTRDDDYGIFSASWDDSYWFDPSTGLLVGEVYTEQDSNAAGDSFRWREIAAVTSSSYPIAVDWAVLLGVYAGIPALVVVALVSVRWYHRGPRHVMVPGSPGPVRATLRRVRDPRPYLQLDRSATGAYAAVLPTVLARSARRRNPIWVASDGRRLLGAMVRDREAKVATLFTNDPGVAAKFRSMHRAPNFFTEVPEDRWKPKASLVESFALLRLSPIAPPREDTSDVRPMELGDMPAVLALAKHVYRIPEPLWLRQAFEEGDLAFVAIADLHVVGFAFATVGDDVALLHTLTVDPAYRGRGFGRALMAARLSALRSLGVPAAIVEISEHNPASLAVARRFAFVPVGRTLYYARKVRKARPVDRRPS